MRNYLTLSVSFFGFFQLATPNAVAPILTVNTSKDISRKHVPFEGPENEILYFDPISPKTEIFGRFLPGQNFGSNRALTGGTLSVNVHKTTSYAFRGWIIFNRQIDPYKSKYGVGMNFVSTSEVDWCLILCMRGGNNHVNREFR